MRMDQFEGLSANAIAFLKKHEVFQKICKCCKRSFPRDLEIIGYFYGMSGVMYPLHRHRFKGGGYADEFLQATEYSSGPMFFLGLTFEDGSKRFTWSQAKIEEKNLLRNSKREII